MVLSLILVLSVSFVFLSIVSASSEATNETDSSITPYIYAVNVADTFKEDYRYDTPIGRVDCMVFLPYIKCPLWLYTNWLHRTK